MSKIIKNQKSPAAAIVLKAVGREVPASGQIEVHTEDYLLWASEDSITEITPLINSGDIVINDSVDDITVANGFSLARAIDFLKYVDQAFHQRFAAEPERSNGFSAKNVQEAIEESKANIEGKTTALPSFMNNGITKDKWLALDGSMSPSNELPAVIAFRSSIASLVFINKNDDADTDIEIYKNGVLDFTWEIRNKRWTYKTNGLTTISFNAGDKISCFAKSVTSGTGVDPSSVILDVVVRSTSSITGEDGSSTL